MKYVPELGFFGNLEKVFKELTKTNNTILNNKINIDNKMAENLAETDEIAIELYEANIAQESINAEQDEAIIELYEKIGGSNNG